MSASAFMSEALFSGGPIDHAGAAKPEEGFEDCRRCRGAGAASSPKQRSLLLKSRSPRVSSCPPFCLVLGPRHLVLGRIGCWSFSQFCDSRSSFSAAQPDQVGACAPPRTRICEAVLVLRKSERQSPKSPLGSVLGHEFAWFVARGHLRMRGLQFDRRSGRQLDGKLCSEPS